MADTNADNPQYQDDQDGFDVAEQPMSQDYGTPAALPDDVVADKKFPDGYPQEDTGIDQHEAYDAGLATASGANAQEDEEHEDETRIG